MRERSSPPTRHTTQRACARRSRTRELLSFGRALATRSNRSWGTTRRRWNSSKRWRRPCHFCRDCAQSSSSSSRSGQRCLPSTSASRLQSPPDATSARNRSFSSAGGLAVEKGPHVVAELLWVLVEEAVAGVGIDPQFGVREMLGEQVAVLGVHHRV